MIRGLNLLKKSHTIGGIINNSSNKSFYLKQVITSLSSSTLINNNNKASTLQINSFSNKRFYSTENKTNVLKDLTVPADQTTTTAVDALANVTAATGSTITETITKEIPSYIINPTMGPDASRISEWFHQLNFDIISMFNDLNVQYGIPWIGIIAGTAMTLRLLTLPVSIKTQKDGVIMRKVKEEVEKHSYLNDGTTEGRLKVMNLQQQIMKKHGLSTMSTLLPNLLQLPFILYPFVLLRQLCADTTLLNNAGFLWFKNLSEIDPFYVLPIVSSCFQFASVRFSMADDAAPAMKYVMTGLCFVPLIFTVKFAAGLNIYWAINSIIFAMTNYFLKTRRGAKLFGIPWTEKVQKIKVAPETFTMVKNAANTNSNPKNNTTVLNNNNNNAAAAAAEEIAKRENLLKEVQAKQDLLEKKRQELKTFGRRK